MSFSVVVTPGASTANSYVTTAEADAYIIAHPDYERWDALDTIVKGRYVVMATRDIDRLPLRGEKRDTGIGVSGVPNQALFFPRGDDVVASGTSYIPVPVKQACIEQALYLVQTGRGEISKRRQLQMEGVASVNVAGDIAETYNPEYAKEFCAEAKRILLNAGLLQITGTWA